MNPSHESYSQTTFTKHIHEAHSQTTFMNLIHEPHSQTRFMNLIHEPNSQTIFTIQNHKSDFRLQIQVTLNQNYNHSFQFTNPRHNQQRWFIQQFQKQSHSTSVIQWHGIRPICWVPSHSGPLFLSQTHLLHRAHFHSPISHFHSAHVLCYRSRCIVSTQI